MFAFSALACAAALTTWWIHTFVGHRVVLNPMLRAEYSSFARATMEVCWHITTLFLAMVTLMLLVATLHPNQAINQVLLWFALVCSLSSTLVFPIISKRRFGRWLALPQVYLLGSIALSSTAALLFPLKISSDAGLAFALGLLLMMLALLHIFWARGGAWPSRTRSELGALVVGQPKDKPFPGKGLTFFVAALFGLAGLAFLATAFMEVPAKWLLGFTWFVTAIFFARGILGFFDPMLRPWTKNLPFKHWNLVLYSPICLLMGAMALGLAWGGP